MRRFTLMSAAAAVALTVALPASVIAGEDAERDEAIRLVRADRVELLRLDCSVRDAASDVVTDSAVAVGCEWSRPTADGAMGVRLVRLDREVDDHRRVIFRTDDLDVTSYTDTKVRRGHVYVYAVQSLDAHGRVVGQSEPVRVRIPRLRDVEVLRLECRLGPAHEAIGCEWSLPRHRDAAVISLWRSVDGGARELVEVFRPTGPNAYRDPVPAGASKITYAVIATTTSDRIVARSRPETVRIPDRIRAQVARR